MKFITREEARELGLKEYFIGESCKCEHILPRRVDNNGCKECQSKARKKYWGKNKIAFKKRNREWIDNNRERFNTLQRDYARKNPEKYRERSLEYRRNNLEKVKISKRKAYFKYKNTPKYKLKSICYVTSRKLSIGKLSESKLSLLEYTPEEFIDYILQGYEFNSVQDAYDVGYHIDHIVPLSYISKNIQELELQFCVAMDLYNLRLIKGEENLFKGNKIDFPEVQEAKRFLWNKYNIL